jgi:hypothetical protein
VKVAGGRAFVMGMEQVGIVDLATRSYRATSTKADDLEKTSDGALYALGSGALLRLDDEGREIARRPLPDSIVGQPLALIHAGSFAVLIDRKRAVSMPLPTSRRQTVTTSTPRGGSPRCRGASTCEDPPGARVRGPMSCGPNGPRTRGGTREPAAPSADRPQSAERRASSHVRDPHMRGPAR